MTNYETYESTFCTRYASEEMQFTFSAQKKFSTFRRVWVALARAEMKLGLEQVIRREHREHSVRMVLGRVCIQISQKKLLVDDKELPLTKAEYEICEFLAKNRGQVFSKEQILEAVFEMCIRDRS